MIKIVIKLNGGPFHMLSLSRKFREIHAKIDR